jgi:ribonucleoside-diphosphate reductase alpha chain
MAILRVDHPDIEDFISAKANPLDINTFNISVAVTDEFMKRLDAGESYGLVNPRTGRETGKLDARKLFDRIVESAWRNGEPGVIFIDRINRDNPTPELGQIESTNPCGEQPLLPYESCVLGSINLSRFHREGRVDYDRLREVVALGVHFLDNIIDVSQFPIPQIGQVTRANRKIGLGVMGWADLLIELGISYASNEATGLADEVMRFISDEALRTSTRLADKRGPFPRWYQEKMYQNTHQPPQRNATITTVAPTGTISLIADCSSGIEPIYSVAYLRRSFESEHLMFVHPLFEKYARNHGFYSDTLMTQIARHGSLDHIAEIPVEARRLFVTTHEIAPEWHVQMQAAFQKHIDAAVSKTINFPNTASVEDVRQAYLSAYELGCKGLTIYRDGSREKQVLSTQPSGLREPTPLADASQAEIQSPENQLLARNMCPDCGSVLQHNGGCLYCTCGYSVCVQT